MSNQSLRLIVHQTINPGGLEEFKRIAQMGATNAETKEAGTLGYEFFFNETGTECYLNEYYVDSDAFVTHFANVKPILEESMKVSKLVGAIVLGNPTPEARNMLAGLGAKFYSDCIGFCR